MRKQWTSILAGLALMLTGCSQAVEMKSSPAPSMGTLRHRGKSYDLRRVVTADARQRRNDPFLREMAPDRTYAQSDSEIWAGQDISDVEIEDNLLWADSEGPEYPE